MTTWTDPAIHDPAIHDPSDHDLTDHRSAGHDPGGHDAGEPTVPHEAGGHDPADPTAPREPGDAPDATASPPPGGASHQPPPPARRLSRSNRNRVVAGVCGGIAEHTGVDVTVVRLLALLLMALGQGIVLYLAAWLLMPGPEGAPSAFEAWRERRAQRL